MHILINFSLHLTKLKCSLIVMNLENKLVVTRGESREGSGTHSSPLAWKIPWTEEPAGLQSMGSPSRTRLSDFTFTFHFRALEKEMAAHSSVLACRISGMGEPGGLPSMGLQSRTRLKRLSSSSSSRGERGKVRGKING